MILQARYLIIYVILLLEEKIKFLLSDIIHLDIYMIMLIAFILLIFLISFISLFSLWLHLDLFYHNLRNCDLLLCTRLTVAYDFLIRQDISLRLDLDFSFDPTDFFLKLLTIRNKHTLPPTFILIVLKML